MPYKRTDDLPDRVKENLSKHAQHIYRKAFNNAEKQYKDPAKRRKGGSREETAHRVAWNAVKPEYKKAGDRWVRKGT